MYDEFIGMITAFAGNYVPANYIECDGRKLSIRAYTPLFALIGITYGGDGKEYFNVPDLRGRSIIGTGTLPVGFTRRAGQTGGAEQVSLDLSTLPPHNHPYYALSGDRESQIPTNNYIGKAGGNFYARKDSQDVLIQMNHNIISAAPGGQIPHNNMAPFLCVTYGICFDGVYPDRAD